MTITFHIEYSTQWGEDIRITGSIPQLGANQIARSIPLQTTDGKHWTLTMDFEDSALCFTYNYCIFKEGVVSHKEWDSFPRYMDIPFRKDLHIHTHDQWKMVSGQQYFYSSAFTDCLFARDKESAPIDLYKRTIILKAHFPRLSKDYTLGITGNQRILGDWDENHPLLLHDNHAPEWQISLDVAAMDFPFEYKFVLYDKRKGKAVAWELHDNRMLPDPNLNSGEVLIMADHYIYFDQPTWRGAGVAVPVFSLRSEDSFGSGDFNDLRQLIDWAVDTNQKIIQILPIYDTTKSHGFTDSYPYSSISIYALHPMYLNLKNMGQLKEQSKQAYFDALQHELNALPAIDYVRMMEAKWEYFHAIYAQEGDSVLSSKGYKQFHKENQEWLIPYAAFCYLREKHHTANFNDWPTHAVYDAKAIHQMCLPESPTYRDMMFHCYLQYELHRQLSETCLYARQKGIILKGDIPIGISRDSVEAWMEPHYFNLNGQAGAPPDDFSTNGQNWGFPTYNWDVMAADHYQWWMKRFTKMAQYFDAYRIDHILGFFRIWEIPTHSVHGLLGQFVPALPLSIQEIEEDFGLKFDENRFLAPYINDEIIEALFGEKSEEIKRTYLSPIRPDKTYELRPEYDTQRKIELHFAENGGNAQLQEGLYSLVSNVLFVRDHRNPETFHPRICAYNDYLYKLALTDKERACFDRLYEHFYYHRHNEFWRQQAMKKLPALVHATRMLVCGEDLGMIPACVPQVMEELQILSLEIQRMPKALCEFSNLSQNPYRSVCTISTHDMSTLRGWWAENPEQTQRYYNQVLGYEGNAPSQPDGKLCEDIIHRHLTSPSMFVILALQDWMSMDEDIRFPDADAERINVPADPQNYWRYRMHLTIDQLREAHNLNKRIKQLINISGRNEIF